MVCQCRQRNKRPAGISTQSRSAVRSALVFRGLLEPLTTPPGVGIVSNVKAVVLIRTRIVYSTTAFAELVLWHLPKPLAGCTHRFKYRLAYVVDGTCVLRYENGKGDHRHYRGKEHPYAFSDPETLIAAFQTDIARWNHENRDT
ncbi:MAG: DUF6516 family protein [Nitrospira sp.]|nr:DUF6516 family protein [Nitrospira sp.]